MSVLLFDIRLIHCIKSSLYPFIFYNAGILPTLLDVTHLFYSPSDQKKEMEKWLLLTQYLVQSKSYRTNKWNYWIKKVLWKTSPNVQYELKK